MADDGSQHRKPGFKTAVEDVKALATVLAMEAESILGRRTARVLGAVVLFAAVVGILVWYIAPSGAAQKQALVVTLAQILGGTALLSGLYFTWRTLQVNYEGQITERFTRAIDQLGKVDEHNNKLLEIRMGAIYALERIARESITDSPSIMEILTAYVRHNSPLKEANDQDDEDEGEFARVTHAEPDIQAILGVIGRRSQEQYLEEQGRLNLERTDLRNGGFYRANLAGVWFHEADLHGAYLREADLSDTYFYSADLSRAFFGATEDIEPARIKNTNFTNANLEESDLSGLDLTEAIGLTQTQIDQAMGDEETRLPDNPDNLQIPDHWVEERNAQPNEA